MTKIEIKKVNKPNSLGILEKEKKQYYWNSTISGSQIKQLMASKGADDLIGGKLKAAKVKGFEKYTTSSEMKFSAKTQAIMNEGTRQEPLIFNHFKQEEKFQEMKKDKATFISENYPFLTANIDGYISNKKGNKIETIIEIKNSSNFNEKNLLNRYKWQIIYYMWFFNAKNAYLLIRHYNEVTEQLKYSSIFIPRDKIIEKELLRAVVLARQAWEEHKLPSHYYKRIYLQPAQQQIIDYALDFAKLKEDQQTLKKSIDVASAYFKKQLGNEKAQLVQLIVDDNLSLERTIKAKTTINYNDLIQDFAKQLKLSDVKLAAIINQYTDTKTQETLTLKKYKIKDK